MRGSQPMLLGLVLGLAAAWHLVCIHEINRMNSSQSSCDRMYDVRCFSDNARTTRVRYSGMELTVVHCSQWPCHDDSTSISISISIMLTSLGAALSVAPRPSIRPVPPISRNRKGVETSNFAETWRGTKVTREKIRHRKIKGQGH